MYRPRAWAVLINNQVHQGSSSLSHALLRTYLKFDSSEKSFDRLTRCSFCAALQKQLLYQDGPTIIRRKSYRSHNHWFFSPRREWINRTICCYHNQLILVVGIACVVLGRGVFRRERNARGARGLAP